MKAIILIGGPAPAEDGNINTHMCVVWWPALTSTNRSLDMKLEYRETLTSPSPSPGWAAVVNKFYVKSMARVTAHDTEVRARMCYEFLTVNLW